MSEPPAFKRLPRLVAARKFAQQGVVLEGQIAVQELKRLAQSVQSIDAPVEARLQFDTDGSGHRTIEGSLLAQVHATCERCMQGVPLTLQSEMAVAMISSDEAAKQLPKELEPWLIDPDAVDADLYEAVEDELLLALPMVVYHDYPCIDDSLYSSGEAEQSEMPEDKPNPFQVLEKLKVGKKD